jgi:hypothetical protein
MIKFEHKAPVHYSININNVASTVPVDLDNTIKLYAFSKLVSKIVDNDFYKMENPIPEEELLYAACQVYTARDEETGEEYDQIFDIDDINKDLHLVYVSNGIRCFVLNNKEFLGDHYRVLFYKAKLFDSTEDRVTLFLDSMFCESNDDGENDRELVSCIVDVLDGILIRKSGLDITVTDSICDGNHVNNDAYFRTYPSILDLLFIENYNATLIINILNILGSSANKKELILQILCDKSEIPLGLESKNVADKAYATMLNKLYDIIADHNIDDIDVISTNTHMEIAREFYMRANIGWFKEDEVSEIIEEEECSE